MLIASESPVSAYRNCVNFGAKLLLTFAAITAVAAPIAISVGSNLQLDPPHPDSSKPLLTFEVASIKPSSTALDHMSIRHAPGGRYIAHGLTAKMLIVNAYGVHDFQISGGPDWINSAKYDIEAKADEDDNPASLPARLQATRQRLQSLLADRFNFKFHTGTKELPIYALVVGKAGSRLQPPANPGTESMSMSDGKLAADSMSMDMFARNLSNILGRIVQDKTGMAGSFSFTLRWTPKEETSSEASAPSIFTALQEQLGLRLESQKGPVQIVIVDHVDRPSEN